MFALFSFLTRMFMLLTAAVFGAAVWAYITFGNELPDYTALTGYRPAIVSHVFAGDGSLLSEFAREKRVFMPIDDIPIPVRQAFISAEDRRFYSHRGIDPIGVARAFVHNILHLAGDRRSQGGSGITQQVVKNMLLGNERTWQRKVKEAILALRLERVLSKDKILELYLNDIYLGEGAYGVNAAARVYFDKLPSELTLAEAAFLAALPKAPNNYNPVTNPGRAVGRRNEILQRMREDGAITPEQEKAADLEPIKTAAGVRNKPADGAYFAEDIRRQLIDMFGEREVYAAGLNVFSTADPQLQAAAERALREGLQRYDRAQGYRGPLARAVPGAAPTRVLSEVKLPRDLTGWQPALVTALRGKTAVLAIGKDAAAGTLSLDAAREDFGRKPVHLQPGDVIVIEMQQGSNAALRQIPQINGALAALDPHTGRVLAMQGGFSHDMSEFNRVTQALRQPGSLFKPIVYAAALDSGYTPTSPVSDEPITLENGNGTLWTPANFDKKYLGIVPMRIGLERSRNLMTVRIAHDIGSEKIVDYARRLGVSDNPPAGLAAALGAGETTLLRMMSAYAVFASGGKQVLPTLIDTVYDRNGKPIVRSEPACTACTAYDPRAPFGTLPALPDFPDTRPQILDAQTAFQITDMLTGVIQRGTGRALADLNVPLAGKTGTTNDAKDVWFMAYTPDLVVGCYLGYDNPRSLGGAVTAGQLAAPVVKSFLVEALKIRPSRPFPVPDGMVAVRTDPHTGLRSEGADAVLTYYKPGTENAVRSPAPESDAPLPVDEGTRLLQVPVEDEPADSYLTPPVHEARPDQVY